MDDSHGLCPSSRLLQSTRWIRFRLHGLSVGGQMALYPVFYRELSEKGHQYFDDDSKKTFEELVRWIDSLDRI